MKAIGKAVQLPAIRAVRSTPAFAALAGPVALGALVAVVAVVALAAPARAQSPLTAAAEGRDAPGGTPVVSIHAGTRVAVVSANDANALVTIEGWVEGSHLAGKVDSFPASVDATGVLRLRASASATSAVLAELRARAGLRTIGKSGTWMQVRRNVWIPADALPASAAAAGTTPGVAPVGAGAMSVSAPTKLLAAPAGVPVAELSPGTIVTPLVHDHGFAKIRIEGWVPERALAPADSALGSQLTAADLHADPDGTRGRTVQWDVEILSLQTADPLRPELAPDEPYLLARGPGMENALLYLAVPPSLLSQAKALPPLTRVLITARVRSGRSEPVGTPILDLKSISKR